MEKKKLIEILKAAEKADPKGFAKKGGALLRRQHLIESGEVPEDPMTQFKKEIALQMSYGHSAERAFELVTQAKLLFSNPAN